MIEERPILMNGTMVRATLGCIKTQTRRVIKPAPQMVAEKTVKPWTGDPAALLSLLDQAGRSCPYGQPGDLLWVRETWQFYDWTEEGEPCIRFAADSGTTWPEAPRGEALVDQWETLSRPENYSIDNAARDRRWRPSIHMPRWASRILLEIVSVRVERLNECSEADAKAEGVIQLDDDGARPEVRTKEGWQLCPTCGGTGLRSTLGAGGGVKFDVDCTDCDTHLKLYRHLWEAINGAGSWDANPWVWVVEFKRVTP